MDPHFFIAQDGKRDILIKFSIRGNNVEVECKPK